MYNKFFFSSKQGKGEMRTYWLLGENRDISKRYVNNITNSNYVTPDLICNADTDIPTLSLSSIENSIHSSSTKISLKDYRESSNLSIIKNDNIKYLNNSQRIFMKPSYLQHINRNCYCHTQCIYNRSSHDNVTPIGIHKNKQDSFKISSSDLDMKHLCVCNLRSVSSSINYPKGPRSAPHITFRQ